RSEHVGRVLDLAATDDGVPFMVMEKLSGIDLAALVRERGLLPIGEACDYLLQACDALGEAHALGIIHRDLKPENLFMTTRADGTPVVKVIDFGVSKMLSRSSEETQSRPSVTLTGTVLGSVGYMSPEQVRSAKRVDLRTDIWSLGCILHELLTGRSPFSGESEGAMARSILLRAPKPLRTCLPDAPAQLEEVVLQCLDKEPKRRF